MKNTLPDLAQSLDVNTPTWKLIKTWLESKQETKIAMLVGSKEHDESNRIRGALSVIAELLALEKAAILAAQNGHRVNDPSQY